MIDYRYIMFCDHIMHACNCAMHTHRHTHSPHTYSTHICIYYHHQERKENSTLRQDFKCICTHFHGIVVLSEMNGLVSLSPPPPHGLFCSAFLSPTDSLSVTRVYFVVLETICTSSKSSICLVWITGSYLSSCQLAIMFLSCPQC